MASAAILSGSHAAEILRETWTSQFYLDPTEESIVANLVAEPYGTQRIGKKLHLRKIAAQTVRAMSASTTQDPGNMTFTQNTEADVECTPSSVYAALEFNPDTLEQIVDDGEAVAAYRKQLMAAITEEIDRQLLQLAESASLTETGASFTEAMWQAGIAKLAKNAKRKFRIGKTPYNLVLHPDKLAQGLQISALREFQIRGSQGAATSGALVTTYGANLEETGLVSSDGGTYYMPLFIKDAWALGWNQKPKMLEVQNDGLLVRHIAYASFAPAEFFDSSIVSLNIT